MKKTALRMKKCRQIELVDLHFTIDATSGTPVVGGLDAPFVKSITDVGAGVYKVNFHDKAQRNIILVSVQSESDGLYCRATAVDKESITVTQKTFAGVATDGKVSVHCMYHEAKYLY